MNVLFAKTGPLAGSVFPIAGRTLIGRGGECDIQLIDQGISRKHACVLELDDGSVLLRDLASDNGTWVRGEPVVEAKLSPGDEIGVGSSRFEFRIDERASIEAAEPEIKLMSGPARSTTVETVLTAEQRARLIAAMQAQRHEAQQAQAVAAAPAAEPAAVCCGSPLAAHAIEHKWKFCPACGAALPT